MSPAEVVERPRRRFVDKALLYLFSYDVEADTVNEDIGFVPSGVRFNVVCLPQESRIYHVLREPSVGGPGALGISGSVIWGKDSALIRQDAVALSHIRMTIKTNEGVLIDSEYRGVFALGLGGYHEVIRMKDDEEKKGTEERPFEARVVINPVYMTADPRYRWLTQKQCVGFGRVQLVRDRVRRISYDIYAMD
jgi:hypothetical protein